MSDTPSPVGLDDGKDKGHLACDANGPTNQVPVIPTFERKTIVRGAFDRRHSDPSKNYGIHGMELLFILHGEKGATQFLFYSCQHMRHVADELFSNNKQRQYNPFHGMGADIGYHSPAPRYEGQAEQQCNILPSGKCYYDGTSLGASEFADEFIAGGDETVWPMLERRYNELFNEDATERTTVEPNTATAK